MKTILVLTDFSAEAKNAADWAVKLAVPLRANILLLNTYLMPALTPAVNDTEWPGVDDLPFRRESETALNQEAHRLQRQLEYRKSGSRPQLFTRSAEGTPTANAADILKEIEVILAVMGAPKKVHSDFLFPNNRYAAIDQIKCPLLIIPGQSTPPIEIRNVVFATNLDDVELKALLLLRNLASTLRFQLHVCHVSRPVLIPDFREEDRLAAFHRTINEAGSPAPSFMSMRDDDVPAALHACVTMKHAEILAVVHQRHSFIWRAFHYSVSKKLAGKLQAPMLVIPSNS